MMVTCSVMMAFTDGPNAPGYSDDKIKAIPGLRTCAGYHTQTQPMSCMHVLTAWRQDTLHQARPWPTTLRFSRPSWMRRCSVCVLEWTHDVE